MQIRSSALGVAIYLAPQEALTHAKLDEFVTCVTQAREPGVVNVVVDLAAVPLLDSRALEYLLDLAADLREAGGSLRLAGPNELCADILSVTRVDQMVPVFADAESAGGSFL